MIILAVGFLAVLAIAATAYIAVARLDRAGASAYQRSTSFETQVNAVVDHIGALLTADLYGGKVVRRSTPSVETLGGRQTLVWPRAFEDGEYSDYPRTAFLWDGSNRTTFDTSEPNDRPTDEARLSFLGANQFIPDPLTGGLLQRFAPVPADDCWLASSEPIDARDNTNRSVGADGLWDTWPQITNLRCAWEYRDPDGVGGVDPTWIRGDGRYADLGQWIIQNLDGRGDPAANLTYEVDPVSRNPVSSDSNVFDPLIEDLVGAQLRNGPEAAVNQPVYGVQMAHIADQLTGALAADLNVAQCPANLDCQEENQARLSDERFWADCDGDLYPDCRWQQLDVLGDLFGLRWVVAARIVDHSALVNMNASLAFNYGNANPNNVSDGMTPADVDLARLLRRSSVNIDVQRGHPDVRVDSARADLSIRNHINNGLRLEEDAFGLATGEGFIRAFSQGAMNQPLRDELLQFFPSVSSAYNSTNIGNLTRDQRFAYYRFVGASPQRPRVGDAFAYPQGDEIDLRAYWGFNNPAITAKYEEHMDGPIRGVVNPLYVFGTQANFGNPMYDPYGAAPPEIGLVRSNEVLDEARTYREESLAQDANPVGGAMYGQEGKVTRVMRDVRRLMTTVSGVSHRSPVPVLNTSAGRFRNATFLDKPVLADAIDASSGPDREFIRRAFESFVWALAPFATDQPLMHPMTTLDASRVGSQFHYGGAPTGVAGVARGPAKAIEDAGNPAMGASYAVLRALALAVNLHDALDREGSAAGASANPAAETPTVVRFFPDNAPDLSLNQWLPGGSATGALTTSFAQGEIDIDRSPNLLPQQYAGQRDVGLTAVGLETQPFLVSALAYSAYRDECEYSVGTSGCSPTNNDAPDGTGPNPPGGQLRIDTTQSNEQLGSIFGVEVGNPWPVGVSTANYSVRVSDGGSPPKVLEFDLPVAAIEPGQSVLFYLSINNASPAHQPDWDEIILEFQSRATTDDVIEVNAAGATIPNNPSMGEFNLFEPFGPTARLPVQLIYNLGGTRVLVDRLTPPVGDAFPVSLSASISGTIYEFMNNPSPPATPSPPGESPWTGRVAYTTFLRRPAGASAAGGFPGFVVEKPSANSVTDIGPIESTWLTADTPPSAIDMIVDNMPPELGLAANVDVLSGLRSFQLFVPNGPLFSVSELGQISAFCHLYKPAGASPLPPTLDNAHAPPTTPGVAGLAGASDQWLTVSEQLGADWHLFYDGSPGGTPNPYLGVLDLSRFTPGGDLTNPMSSGNPLPDALAVPLASRVFDAFEGVKPIDDLTQGKININTASLDVLRLLPLLSPNDLFADPLVSVIAPNEATSGRITSNTDRAATIAAYRDAREDIETPLDSFGGTVAGQRAALTTLAGLRNRQDVNRVANAPGVQIPTQLRDAGPFAGVQTLGELALLAQWDQTNGMSPTADVNGMADMLPAARDTQNNPQVPLDLREHLVPTYDGVDDPEERLALFRAISNIASTRSDVFGAWFILRGFSPERIEAVEIFPGQDGNPIGIMELLNQLEDIGGIVYETRWFVLFDRSNVRRPSDRPRVLLKVEMPLE